MDTASIRDFQGGTGSHMVDALERTLLLPSDMVELQSFRRQEIFLSLKRHLGTVRFPIHSVYFFFFFSLCSMFILCSLF